MTSRYEIFLHTTGPLWGESTGHQTSKRPVKLSFDVSAWIRFWTNNRVVVDLFQMTGCPFSATFGIFEISDSRLDHHSTIADDSYFLHWNVCYFDEIFVSCIDNFGAVRDQNFVKMMTCPFRCLRYWHSTSCAAHPKNIRNVWAPLYYIIIGIFWTT